MSQNVENSCGTNSKNFWNQINNLPSAKSFGNSADPSKACKQLRELADIPHQEYFNYNFEKETVTLLEKYKNDMSHFSALELDILNRNISM